jgi:hypothetical protein
LKKLGRVERPPDGGIACFWSYKKNSSNQLLAWNIGNNMESYHVLNFET